MYAVSVISLIVVLQDGIVMWYEALLLVLFYMIYIAGKFLFELSLKIIQKHFFSTNEVQFRLQLCIGTKLCHIKHGLWCQKSVDNHESVHIVNVPKSHHYYRPQMAIKQMATQRQSICQMIDCIHSLKWLKVILKLIIWCHKNVLALEWWYTRIFEQRFPKLSSYLSFVTL